MGHVVCGENYVARETERGFGAEHARLTDTMTVVRDRTAETLEPRPPGGLILSSSLNVSRRSKNKRIARHVMLLRVGATAMGYSSRSWPGLTGMFFADHRMQKGARA